MLLEHLVYTFALSIIVGMFYTHYTGRNPAWIVLVSCVLPDIDYIFQYVTTSIVGLGTPYTVYHGDFHNVLALAVFALGLGWFLTHFGVRFCDAVICVGAGFTAHVLEDIFVYENAYPVLAPFSQKIYGLGVIPETRDILWGWGDFKVLMFGFVLVVVALVIKHLHERKMRVYYDKV